MAFTDLDEHLAEAFGERVAEHFAGFGLLDKRPNKERYSPGVYEAKEARKAERKHASRALRHLEDLATGRVPSTCLGPTCCNLMPIALPEKGPAPTVCSTACMSRLRRWRRRHEERGGDTHHYCTSSVTTPASPLGRQVTASAPEQRRTVNGWASLTSMKSDVPGSTGQQTEGVLTGATHMATE